VRRYAGELGLRDIACAVVVGDDVGEVIKRMPELPLMETGEPLETLLPRMVSANAYLGADTVKAGLDTGADVVLTGRVADPSLFLGTVMHHFGWDYEDWPRLAAGTVAGHLLECSGSVTGGCFAWPGKRRSRVWRGSASRWPMSAPTARSISASRPGLAAGST
jgi:acyclic terpene utilization AtuA family protein